MNDGVEDQKKLIEKRQKEMDEFEIPFNACKTESIYIAAEK